MTLTLDTWAILAELFFDQTAMACGYARRWLSLDKALLLFRLIDLTLRLGAFRGWGPTTRPCPRLRDMGSLGGFSGVNAFNRLRGSDLGRVDYKTQQMLEASINQHPDTQTIS